MPAPINLTESRTHALNAEGVFFQQRVAAEFRRIGWTLAAQEYPVAFPRGTGPLPGKEGRLDLLVRNSRQITHIWLAVECKKADRKYKEWVFFPNTAGGLEAMSFGLNEQAAYAADDPERWTLRAK